jgi:hypothetical protein
VHADLFRLSIVWGLGGLLAELERLGIGGRLPPAGVELRRALTRYLTLYDLAPRGTDPTIWRDRPCPHGGAPDA